MKTRKFKTITLLPLKIQSNFFLIVKYRENYRVVRFEVETRSVSHEDIKFKEDSCDFSENARPQYISRVGKSNLFFTYSVEWKQSDVRWASRWDSYLAMSDVQIHWFSIVNSLIVVFFLSGILTMIIIRTLRRDIAKCVIIIISHFYLV